MRIEVIVKPWPNRSGPGVFRQLDPDRGVILEARCLAKADNGAAAKAGNPSRNPLFRMGDLPAGEYLARIEKPQLPERTYGKHRVLRLIPVSGPCVLAFENGRAGILQHSGVLNAQGKLRPTNGCNRVDDETQEAMLTEMDKAGLTEIPYIVKEEA